MIITKLKGGLGNQMFQYAIGRNLSIIHNTQLKLDTSFFQERLTKPNFAKRYYNLNIFNIVENFASKDEIEEFKKYEKIGGYRKFFHDILKADETKYIKEKQCSFDKNILRASDNIYLDGYWQSEKYFSTQSADILSNKENIENLIRQEFTLKNEFQIKNIDLTRKIKNSNSISIHIRRGDYTDSKTKKSIGLCPVKYYHQAITEIINKVKNPIFFIFSDDIKWSKNNLQINLPATFIDGNKNYEDLILMSMCKHNIIANSSFSWWGAWLNQNPNKIVIAPKKWFVKTTLDTKDLIPNAWIRI